MTSLIDKFNFKPKNKNPRWFTTTCRKCGGSGRVEDKMCRRCLGHGKERVNKENQEVIR